MEKIYTVREVARELKTSVRTVREAIRAGDLHASKVGREYRVMESDIVAYLKR